MFHPKFFKEFPRKPNSTLPLAKRIHAAITEIKGAHIKTIERRIPQWTFQRPNIYLQLKKKKKRISVKGKLEQLIDSILNSLYLYRCL